MLALKRVTSAKTQSLKIKRAMPHRALSWLVPFCFSSGDVLNRKKSRKKGKEKKRDPGGQTQENRVPKHMSASNYLEIELKKRLL